jgi:phosphopantothenoylcysteine decarboxylase/phosphopantothenate--cysteine ligase
MRKLRKIRYGENNPSGCYFFLGSVFILLQGKTIVLGVTGGIAAYKAVALASKLVQLGASVHVIMTAAAVRFIAPLSFQAITRQRVIVDTFAEEDPSVITHIDLADRADAVVIAPATADIIAKLALGLADDMLTTTMLAVRSPIVIAPAMNVNMYAHVTVQSHMNTLRARGFHWVEPGEGFLACGYVGKGRMAEPEHIVATLLESLAKRNDLNGIHVLVTAGATIEHLDPVRYITNESSGKMGFAIAEAARDRGARVTMIMGKTEHAPPQGVHIIQVISAEEMFDAAMKHFQDADIIVKAAAVADYRPVIKQSLKIKKNTDPLTIELERTPDILQEIGVRKKAGQVIVGFAAETHDIATYAMSKARSKRCDFVVANDVTIPGAGFGTDTNIVSFYSQDGLIESLPLQTKRDVAEQLITKAHEMFTARNVKGNSDR